MLCARKVKRKDGTLGKNPSNHSWGMAIDIKINGKLDKHGDDKTQRGLLMLARYMNAAGWYWGVSFPTEEFHAFRGEYSAPAKMAGRRKTLEPVPTDDRLETLKPAGSGGTD